MGFPCGAVVTNLPANTGRCKRLRLNPSVGKLTWRKTRQPTPVFSPGASCGQKSGGLQSIEVTESWTWLKQLSKNADMVNIFNQLTLRRLPLLIWVDLIQSFRSFQIKNWGLLEKKEFCLQTISFCLLAWRLTSTHSLVTQSLKEISL